MKHLLIAIGIIILLSTSTGCHSRIDGINANYSAVVNPMLAQVYLSNFTLTGDSTVLSEYLIGNWRFEDSSYNKIVPYNVYKLDKDNIITVLDTGVIYRKVGMINNDYPYKWTVEDDSLVFSEFYQGTIYRNRPSAIKRQACYNRRNKNQAPEFSFTCRLPELARLTNVKTGGIHALAHFYGVMEKADSLAYLTLDYRKGAYSFSFTDWTNAMHFNNLKSTPLWYRCLLPTGIKSVIACDVSDFFFVYHNNSLIWLHVQASPVDYSVNQATYLPSSTELEGIRKMIQKSDMGKGYTVRRNRGFAAAYNIPERQRPFYAALLDASFSITPAYVSRLLNSMTYVYVYSDTVWPEYNGQPDWDLSPTGTLKNWLGFRAFYMDPETILKLGGGNR